MTTHLPASQTPSNRLFSMLQPLGGLRCLAVLVAAVALAALGGCANTPPEGSARNLGTNTSWSSN
ncbi:MAG TPA: hypothetical protein VFA54_02470, partial [Bryobacterales bacterium]|nr:hypothetical protein [Bryobacterales bacterium]